MLSAQDEWLAEKLASSCVEDQAFKVGTGVLVGSSKKKRGSPTHIKSDTIIIEGGEEN